MSFCKNCGTDVGENRFCSNCGTAVVETATNTTTPNAFSEYYQQICEYERDAVGVFLFGILSLVFCMGIGLIFEIIAIIKVVKMKRYNNLLTNELPITHPLEMEKLEYAKRKHKSGTLLISIALWITCILFCIIIVQLYINFVNGMF